MDSVYLPIWMFFQKKEPIAARKRVSSSKAYEMARLLST